MCPPPAPTPAADAVRASTPHVRALSRLRVGDKFPTRGQPEKIDLSPPLRWRATNAVEQNRGVLSARRDLPTPTFWCCCSGQLPRAPIGTPPATLSGRSAAH